MDEEDDAQEQSASAARFPSGQSASRQLVVQRMGEEARAEKVEVSGIKDRLWEPAEASDVAPGEDRVMDKIDDTCFETVAVDHGVVSAIGDHPAVAQTSAPIFVTKLCEIERGRKCEGQQRR